MDDAELASRLAARVGAAGVRDLTRLSGGASRETWSFSAVDADGIGRPLILQRQRPGAEREISVEASVLRTAAIAGVPVPPIVAAGDEPDELGAPYLVLEHVAGETIARKILRDDQFAEARRLLPGQLGRALAALHRADPRDTSGLVADDQVTRYREVLDQSGQPHPAFELAFRWLEANRPPSGAMAIVHGDFRLGNLIIGPDGLRAVIDWELAHLGDPMEDLGWLCVKAWRFGARPPVGGVGEYRELFDAYSSASGRAVDPDLVRWWEVLGTLKWGIMCIMQAATHLTGVNRSHELAAIGRRVCENEHDLLLVLP
jgi:aminoglycoside phosphotransferase (APT) family kinase protein